jgi:hypothetical protein
VGSYQALPKCYGATGAAPPLGGVACGGVVVSAAEGPRQAFRSKRTNPIATALATTLKTNRACPKSALADQNPPIVMVPWVAWDTRVMNTLPPVWLNIHVYQNVTATVPRTPPTSTARIRVDTSGERVLCSPGEG